MFPTCIAEVRAPVGSSVVMARFRFLRTVRLLDLEALRCVYFGGSHFDPDYEEHRGRAEFLGSLVGELSKPVMPVDESTEYLMTQAVAEYLASRVAPSLDGIVFRSSQTGGDGRNLLLFSGSCGVEPDLAGPNTDVRVYIPTASQEDWQESIVVSERVPQDHQPKAPPIEGSEEPSDHDRLLACLDQPFCQCSSEPTLRIDLDSVKVLNIKAVRYDYLCQSVVRHASTGQFSEL